MTVTETILILPETPLHVSTSTAYFVFTTNTVLKKTRTEH